MSRILITGGLGFIGHNIAHRLEKLGHEIVVIDTRTNYGIINSDEIKYLMKERWKKIKTPFVFNFDVCDYRNIEYIFAAHKFDTVIHLASFPRQKVVNNNPTYGSQVMCEGLLNLLENSKKFNVKKFVYISSSMVYGDFIDDTTEDTICEPIGQYGILKLTGENLVKDYHRRGIFDYVVIRPSAVYGPLDVTDRVLSKFVISAMHNNTLRVNGAGEKLDFTYIDDTSDGIVLACLNEVANNKTYNITRSESVTLLDAAKLIVETVGSGSIEICDRDINFPSRGSLNIDKARNELNFDPKISLVEGIQKYYDFMKKSDFYNNI